MLRVAHITDIHLTAEPGSELYGVNSAGTVEAVLRHMKALPQIPDVIIATGDLADDGAPSTYTRLRKLLAAVGVPTYVLPGNHDHVGAMRASLTNDVIRFEHSTTLGGWVFMFVNSKVEGKDYGYVAPAELRALERGIADADGRPVVVALHHTPTPRCPSSDCQLTNADELISLLCRYPNVKCTVAGHTHTAVEERHQGLCQYTTPSTFAQVTHAQTGESVDHDDFWAAHKLDGSRHGYRVLDLQPDGRIRTKVHWVQDY